IAKERLNDKEGAIYPALHQLELQGFLKAYFILDNSIEKKYYRITKKGKVYLKEKEKIITHIKNDKKILNKESFICL
ncbi:MAG: PadR family transcriptional regulator, partial [Sarcina sp.]